MKKRCLFALALLLLLAGVAACAKKEEPALEYEREEEGLRVVGVGTFAGDELTIPASHDGMPVISIAFGAFSESEIKKVVLPSSVKTIGEQAFGDSLLEEIEMPAVETIGANAFYGCAALSSLELPVSLVSVAENAFDYCTALSRIDVAGGNPSYASVDGLLYDADLSTLVYVPLAAEGTIHLPATLIAFGEDCFDNRNKLAAAVAEEGNPVLFSLDGVLYGKETTEIFFAPRGLRGEVHIAEGVTKIGTDTFYSAGMSSIFFPSTLQTVEAGAFVDCIELRRIEAAGPVFYAAGNCLIERETGRLVLGCAASEIPQDGSVTEIGDCAFTYCKRLENVALPAGLKRIGKDAFSGCRRLKTATVPASVTEIGAYAFFGCRALESVLFEDAESWTANGEKVDLSDPAAAASLLTQNAEVRFLKGGEGA